MCRAKTSVEDLRVIHATTIVVSERNRYELKINNLKRKLKFLKSMGIVYTECQICDHPFVDKAQKEKHIRDVHIAHPPAN